MCSQESSRRPPGPTARSERAWPSPRGPRLLRSAGEVRAPPLPVGLPLGLAPLRTYCVRYGGWTSAAVWNIYRDESRSEIKCCNPKNQIRDHPEKKWYLSQSGCGIKSGINTTFLARNCGSVAPRAANSSCPLVVLASTSTCPRGSAPMTLSTNVFSEPAGPYMPASVSSTRRGTRS